MGTKPVPTLRAPLSLHGRALELPLHPPSMRSIRPPIRRCRIRCWCPLCGRGVGIDRRCHCRRRRRRPWGRMDDGQTAAYPPEARLLVLLPLHLLHPLLRGRRSGGRGGTRRRPPPPCHRRRRGGTDPAGAGEAGRCGTSSTGYGPTAAAEGTADAGRQEGRHGQGGHNGHGNGEEEGCCTDFGGGGGWP